QFLKKATEFYVDKEHQRMFRRNPTGTPQLVVQDIQRKLSILAQAHNELGHKGEQVVYDLVRLRFYWPYLRKDIHFYLTTCIRCQLRSKIRLELPPT
ncbi:hypothetical protein CYLTODRAFT_334995, partial [Cylindrobasidium torrendii FP15055 ss-10]